MLNSPVCELLDIEFPIIQGGMAWISDGRLAAAVSNAGGLGMISAMNSGPEYLAEQIAAARSLTDKPFGVNIMLMSPFAGEVARVAARERVAVVTTGAGNPARYMKEWLAAGIRVLPVVASVAMAKLAQRAGACAVIAEGGESGGHVGDTSTLVLVPQVCDAVSVPVIAAGGIADARALAAVFMLGARGAQIGTRFLVADECAAHDNYKDKVIKARDISTIVTGRRLGHPVRSLKTAFSRKYAEQEFNAGVSNEDLEAFAVGALRLAAQQGDDMRGCFLAGQAAGLVNRRQPAADIVREMVTGARDILLGAGAWVN